METKSFQNGKKRKNPTKKYMQKFKVIKWAKIFQDVIKIHLEIN